MCPGLKRGAVFIHRALLLYNHLIFTDYEEENQLFFQEPLWVRGIAWFGHLRVFRVVVGLVLH